jgi:hypothetical protein
MGASTSRDPMGLHGLLRCNFTFSLPPLTFTLQKVRDITQIPFQPPCPLPRSSQYCQPRCLVSCESVSDFNFYTHGKQAGGFCTKRSTFAWGRTVVNSLPSRLSLLWILLSHFWTLERIVTQLTVRVPGVGVCGQMSGTRSVKNKNLTLIFNAILKCT